MIPFGCACGKSLRVPDESAGKKIKCPACGKVAVVPAAVPAGDVDQETVALPSSVSPQASGERPTDSLTSDLNATVAPAGSAAREDTQRNDRAGAPDAEGAGESWSLGGYRILRELGRGGMGMVYEALDVKLERRISLKVMKPEIAREPQNRERFLREACTAARVESKFICPIYEVGEDNGVPFIAMPFLAGEPLNARWQKGMRLAIAEVVRIGKDVAEGLSAAQEAGLVHRDIKPANIWLETQPSGPPRAMILDFGLARVQADNVQITQSGAIIGTPAYMSPEQARGEKDLDARTDLFSLGCVLYALCTGELPFPGKQMMEVLVALATHDPAPPHTILATIPQPLSELILRLLAKNPANRPPTARDVIEELAAIERDFVKPAQAALTTRIKPAARSGSRTLPISRDADNTEVVLAGEAPGAPARKTSYMLYTVIALGVLGCIFPLVGGGIYYVVTDNGTIEILSEDANAQVVLLKDGEEIETLDAASKKTWSVRTGAYSLRLKDDPDNLELTPNTFKMERGGKHVVSIRKVKALAEQLLDADEKQFATLLPKLKDRGETDLPVLTGEIDRKLPTDAPNDAREALAKRQANAAVALLRLNQPAKVWPLLQHSPDPRVRSYLIDRLAPLGADPGAIVKQLDRETDPTIRRALLLSLGEFSEKDLTPDARKALLPKLQEMYRTASDPGLHSASEWLLRQWNEEAWLQQTNLAWAGDRQQQLKRLQETMVELKGETAREERRWYVNGQGQTLVVIPGPVEFWMGSPPAEEGRQGGPEGKDELRHWRRIGHSFVIASKEVTVEQFVQFRKTHPVSQQHAPSGDCPVNSVSWYDAAAYCNWLSEQEGLPPEQWCYEPNKQGKYDQGMRMAANYLQRTGYRLPTDAEWEFSCRAGTATRYFFGESDGLLPRYGWSKVNSQGKSWPVGSLKPNDFGLFDVHGNNWEWCLCRDVQKPHGVVGDGQATEDLEVTGELSNGQGLMHRGGGFENQSLEVRSALRWQDPPELRFRTVGFRPARTLPFSSFDRYAAARTAALAAAGQGKEKPPPNGAAKAKLRGQALDWLKAQLAEWSKVQPPRLFVARALWHWQLDSDLAGIRDNAALAKLPAVEQKAFTQLWTDVAKSAAPADSAERLAFARVAALIAAGKGKDEPPLDDATRAKLRGQVLTWLNAELTGARDRAAKARIIAVAALLEGALEKLAESALNDGQFQTELARHFAERGNTPLASAARSKARALFETQLAKDPENTALAAELTQLLFDRPEMYWAVLKPAATKAENGSMLTPQYDGSILVETAAKTAPGTARWQPGPGPVQAVRIETGALMPAPVNGAPGFNEYQIVSASLATARAVALRGQFVRLDLPGDNSRFPRHLDDAHRKSINLAELQVFQGDQNIALRKKARQSSDQEKPRLIADHAVDGNTVGNDQGNPYAHTSLSDSNPWWEVDLGTEQAIDRIVVWNRIEPDRYNVLLKRMNHFRVRVLDQSRKVVFEQVVEHAPNPATEIVPPVFLADATAAPAGENQPLILRLPNGEAPYRVRLSVSGAPAFREAEEDRVAGQTADPWLRLGAAYAANGLKDEASRTFGKALQQPGDRATKAAVELASLLLPRGEAWTVLKAIEMKAESGTKLELQGDGSVFVHKQIPAKNDTYTLVLPTELKGIRGLRLEVLADPRLPGGGSGWNDGYFVLSELTLHTGTGDQAKSIALRNALADFSQEGANVSEAVDGLRYTGWSVWPQGNKDHTAVFELAEHVGDGQATQLTVRLRHLNGEPKSTLGRFRLSVTADPTTLDRDQKHFTALNVADPWTRLATAYALTGQDDEAVQYFGKAVAGADGHEARKVICAHAQRFDKVMDSLVKKYPAEQQLQLARARNLAERGKTALAAAKPADAFDSLKQAEDIFTRLRAPRADWTVLTPVEMKTENGSKLELQKDGAVFVSQPAKKDTYSLVFETELKGIKGLRLEALTDPRLPGGGPGWGPGGNFVLNKLTLQAALAKTPNQPRSIALWNGSADFSQQGWNVRLAADGNNGTGWAVWPEVGKDHTALFELAEEVGDGQPTRLTVRLQHQHGDPHYLLGRFRLSFTTDAATIQRTRLRLDVKDGELIDIHAAMGTAHAQQGQTDEAAAAFARGLALAADRAGKARVVVEAAPLKGVLEKLAEVAAADGQAQAELAQHFSERGQVPLADAARKKARALFEERLGKEPENSALAVELADLLLIDRRVLSPTSESAAVTWRFTTRKPADAWTQADFNDADWQVGVAPFGSADVKVARTAWSTPDIWLRRSFEMDKAGNADSLYFVRVLCDDNATVFLNGKAVAKKEGWTGEKYVLLELEPSVRDLLVPGRNILAVHCLDFGGSASIDVGLSAVPAGSLALAKRRFAAMQLPEPWTRLAAAYALTGHNDEAAQYFGKALEAADGYEARKAILAHVAGLDRVLDSLVKRNPAEPQLQLALARNLTARGKTALAAAKPADAVAPLKQAQDIYDRFPKVTDWTVLTPVEMKTENGSRLELQKDGSVFVHQPAKKDTYTLVFETELKGIKGLRLEALADARLPGGGPGWAPYGGNFVLSQLSLQVGAAKNPDQPRSVALGNASADFSQSVHADWDIRGAVDGNGSRGWAIEPEFNKDHAAVFDTAEEVGDGQAIRLTVRLDHQFAEERFLLGRFRLAFTTDAATLQTTRIRLDLKDSELMDCYAALGTAHAQQGQSDEAVAAFGRGLALARDRAGKARIITEAALLKGALEKLAEAASADGQFQSELAQHFAQRGNKPLADAARTKARAVYEQQLTKDPDNGALASDLAELLLSTANGGEHFWIDDATPSGARLEGNTPWEWVSKPDHPVFRGQKATRRQAQGTSQHFFFEANSRLKLGHGARLFTYVFLDPKDPPKTVMLQFNDGNWEHRAFWGEDLITFGAGGKESHLAMGPLPKVGEWVRLEVEAAKVGLRAGAELNGWAFAQHDGTCYWDAGGCTNGTPCFQSPWLSLAAAYAAAGEKDRAVAYANKALKAADGDLARKAIFEYVVTVDRTFDSFVKSHAAEPQLQLAVARNLAARGRTALAANKPADALAALKQAGDIYSRLLPDITHWAALTLVEMKSENGSKLELQKDGSVFVTQPAKNDTYTLVFQTDLKGIRGLRLEALADSRLPGGGPGWAPDGGNFVLSELSLQAALAKSPDQLRPIALRNAAADFSQLWWDVRGAVDGIASTGWGILPEVNRNHAAVFDTAEDVGDGEAIRLTVRLSHQFTQEKFLLGRFRLWFATDAATLQAARIRFDLKDSELADLHAALGTVHARQGQADEAAAAFARGLALLPDRAGKTRIFTEAAPLAGVLEKLAERADNAERVTLAQIAHDQKQFAFATRVWAKALEADPKLGDDRQTRPRYSAARAATLAAAGQGKEEPPLDDAAKAKLRGQALGWLKGELTAWTELLEASAVGWGGASWVWDRAKANTEEQTNDPRYLRRVFTVAAKPQAAELRIAADNEYTVYINGHEVGSGAEWSKLDRYDVARHLVAGKNLLAIRAKNTGGVAGAIARLHVVTPDQKDLVVGTDDQTRITQTANPDWLKTDFDDSAWPKAVVLGDAGIAPWNLTDKGSKEEARQYIVRNLWEWQQDSDLASLRDAAVLGKLPAEEQKAFTHLWADVAAMWSTQAEAKVVQRPDDLAGAEVLAGLLLERAEPKWVALKPLAARSEGGATLTVQPDNSVLASGVNPDKDVYVFEAEVTGRIGAIRLEAIPDPSLPGGGSGRQGNFILSDFRVTAGESVVRWKRAFADFSQEGPDGKTLLHPVTGAIDADESTGWAIFPRLNEPHWAVFLPVRPMGGGDRTKLTIRLAFQNKDFAKHTLGRFRLSVASEAEMVRQSDWFLAAATPHARVGAAYLAIGDARRAGDFLTRATAANAKPSPADWLVLALAHARLKETDQARKACDIVTELLKPTGADAALRPLLREVVIAVGPGSPTATELIAAATAGEPPAALTEAIQQNPDKADGYRNRGVWFAERARWKEAIADYAEVYRIESRALDALYLGVLLSYHGDRDRYREHCQAMLARWGATDNNAEADLALKTIILLTPDFKADAKQLARLATVVVSGDEQQPLYEYFLFAKGLHAFRTGKDADALAACRASRRRSSVDCLTALNLIVEAMAEERTKKGGRRTLSEARTMLDHFVPGLDGAEWNDWLYARMLYREAEALIGGKAEQRK